MDCSFQTRKATVLKRNKNNTIIVPIKVIFTNRIKNILLVAFLKNYL